MSKLFSLDNKDFLRGLIVAFMTAGLTLLVQMLERSGFALTVEDWKAVLIAGLVSGISYILKNFATDNKGKLLGRIQIK